ncbi:MAG TPA: CPBP family intramembrane metalloprotease [Candidatus Bilophila faecipullorum]|uniref:CPBP family intramembrane metalloprotease n=1 Tax=Candidatus Bilophila faecipullorum TaxID=2838482 RepID=A0A9D1QYF1_9BACT|nr:JDVT-CTERM system glutamic-type intramembrane protease [uncultured Bilophila sp.]HIW77642.1 CPBP family intramembrane metalloprotease [Candidatus Bilophila faecipullorum]
MKQGQSTGWLDIWSGLGAALAPRRCVEALRDRWVWAALALGLAGLPFSPGPMPPFWRLVLTAMTEETVYRALLQEQLEQMLPGRRGPLTTGALIASAIFALSHLPTHTPLMACLTFFPSLIFGVLWTRHRSLWLCAAMHCWYNVAFFL